MSAPDISAEVVEARAAYLERDPRFTNAAATLRALRAALDAAEQNALALLNNDRDVVRVHEGGGPEDVWMSLAVTMAKTREARDAADATGYARGVRDAAALFPNSPRWQTAADTRAAILALLPDATKETRDAE